MSGKRSIKVFLSTFLTLLWISLTSITPAQDVSSLKAIVGVTLVNTDGTEPIKNVVILVEGSKIAKVGTVKKVKIPKDAKIINAEGKWIIPGLVDAHIHFFQSAGLYTRPDVIDLRKFVAYEEEELAQIRENLPDTFARYMRCGITSVVDVGGPFWNYDVRELARKTKLAPRVVVAGPLISTYQPEALTTGDPPIIKVNSVEEAQNLVRRQIEKKTDFIKIWYIVRSGQKPEDHLPLVKATIQESHKNGLRVIVHATQLETARTAVKAGADILAHIVTDKEVDEEFIKLLKDNNVILTPTLIVFEGYSEVLSQQVELSAPEYEYANPYIISTFFDLRELPEDAIPQRVLERIKNPQTISPNPVVLKNLKLLQDGGVTIAAGTDAGNIGTLHGPSIFREFELMAEAGLSPLQILTAATINGAKVTGWQKKLGTIEAGKLADMVILNSDPLKDIRNTSDIHLVIKDGMIFEPAQIIRKKPEDVVQQQLNAYNARDIEAFLAAHSPHIKMFDHPDRMLLSGLDEMREAYMPSFENAPDLHCEIINRIASGNFVIIKGKISGLQDDKVMRGVVIYEVREGLIQQVWILRE